MTGGGLRLMMIAGAPDIAQLAAASGVDAIFVDLESLGKADRQGHLDTWKSPHDMATVSTVRAAVPGTELLVRINPLHAGSGAEIDEALARGADSLMLPMFRDSDTLGRFHDLLRGRARSVPLVETAGALAAVPEILRQTPPDRLHFGLNDLSLDLGRRFLFQPLAEGLLDDAAAALRGAGIAFGIGGVARVGQGAVPAEIVLGEHVRLGSTWAILSRAFHGRADTAADIRDHMDFAAEVARLRAAFDHHRQATPQALAANTDRFRALVGAAGG